MVRKRTREEWRVWSIDNATRREEARTAALIVVLLMAMGIVGACTFMVFAWSR